MDLSEPEVIYRKVRVKKRTEHHGGAWKVAYADFVTAMMAFFLLMWLLGATDEQKRHGIANYFSPTVFKDGEGGSSDGVLSGRSITEPDGQAPYAPGSALATPLSPEKAGKGRHIDKAQMNRIESEIRQRIEKDAGLKIIADQLRFTQTPEGLQIDLIDEADYSMFESGTTSMDPRAAKLLAVVAEVTQDLPNRLAVRGHTDSSPFVRTQVGGLNNNWALSAARAEATRQSLTEAGVDISRFARLEGVADTQPYIPENGHDPRNRRISVTLLNE